MWYDFLPIGGAFILVTYLPNVINPLIEEYFKGNKFYKNTDLPEIQTDWFRNMYLTGNGNKATSVDAIPDLPETSTNQSGKSE